MSVKRHLKAILAEFRKAKVAKADKGFRVIQKVLVRDVWCFLPNRSFRDNGVCKVASVDKDNGSVKFTDGGWSPITDMLTDPNWVLLGRAYRKGQEKLLNEA